MKTSNLFILLSFLILCVSSCKEEIEPIVLNGSSVVDYRDAGLVINGDNRIDDYVYTLPVQKYDPFTVANEYADNVSSFVPSETMITNMKIDFFRMEQVQSVFSDVPDFLDTYLDNAQLILQKTNDAFEIEDIVVAEFSQVDMNSSISNSSTLNFNPIEIDFDVLLEVSDYNFFIQFEFLETQEPIVFVATPVIKFTYDFEVIE